MSYMRVELTGAGAISGVQASPTGDWLLDEVRIHLQAASAAENFTVSIDAGRGYQWDAVLSVTAMNGLTDASYRPDTPRIGLDGDEIAIAYLNSLGIEYGLVIIWRSAA